MLKVEVWSDIACPYCYIGKVNLKEALVQVELSDVKVIFRSFELDPKAPADLRMTIYEQLSVKYGIKLEEAKQMTASIARKAAQTGITMNFDNLIPTNTFDAHRIIHLAQSMGKADEMLDRLFKAFFSDSLNIGKKDVLLDLARIVGLNGQDAENVLNSNAYAKEVRNDETAAANYGINSVPYFLINGKLSLTGAQSVETFAELLIKSKYIKGDPEEGSCANGSCKVY